jgi:hypothetical protein
VLLQCLDSILGLVFLPETYRRIAQKHDNYDYKVCPMAYESGKERGNFNHPGYRAPEVAEELEDRTFLFILD